MKQAPVLNEKQYKRVLAATKMTRLAGRNRLAVDLHSNMIQHLHRIMTPLAQITD
jgi:hypothetical protein